MRATIARVLSETAPRAVVCLDTAFGRLTLRAHVDLPSSRTGQACTCELEVNERIALGRNARLAETESFSLSSSEGGVSMRGIVDAVDPDGMVFLRLAADSLTMIEAAPGELEAGRWVEVTFAADSVVAYLTPRESS